MTPIVSSVSLRIAVLTRMSRSSKSHGCSAGSMRLGGDMSLLACPDMVSELTRRSSTSDRPATPSFER